MRNNVEEAFHISVNIAHQINEPVLRKVAVDVLMENRKALTTLKGSDWQHHNYAGGLIVHICNVTQSAVKLAEFYGDKVNHDLVKFCALMHDIGKVADYSEQVEFPNSNVMYMNQALLGHSFEGAMYVVEKLQSAYEADTRDVSGEYKDTMVIQATHCIGAHMDGFGACAKQQMLEAVLIGCADKIDAYMEQTIVEDKGDSVVLGTGETFYKSLKEE